MPASLIFFALMHQRLFVAGEPFTSTPSNPFQIGSHALES